MKKSLLLCSAVALSASVLSASTKPAADWGNLMGGANGDQSSAIAVYGDGNVLWLSTAASTESAPEIFYGDKCIFEGALYNAGNSGNNNLSLICTGADGSAKWVIYSTSGDYASSQGNVVVDSNGDFVFTAKVRHTDGMLDKPLNIIDASGNKIEFGGTVDRRYNRLLVAKGNASGEILWTKLIDVNTDPAPAAAGNNADFTSDAVSSCALTVDADNNIYIGGNYCAALTVDGVTLQPTNVSTWTGDSQTSCGSMFLIKLNADGAYVASEVGVGDINGYATLQALEWCDGYLYLCAYAKGDGTLGFAGSEFSPSEILSAVIGRLSADLKSDWLKCCPSEPVDGKNALQNVGISLCADNLWVCGQFNQKIIDAGNADKFVAATQGKLREGFIINFDKNTGEWLSSAVSGADFPEITKLTGYLKAIQNADHLDKVFVYGYAMDATIGVFLREYDATTLTPNTENAWSIATGGGVPTACAIAYDSAAGNAYVTARGNKAFTLMGDIETPAPKSWDVLMAKYSLPEDLTTGVENIANEQLNTYDDVFDLYGRKVATLQQRSSLPAGIYIACGKKFIVR